MCCLAIPPFNTPLFQAFGTMSSNIITSAEEESCLMLQNLPAHLMLSVQGLLMGIAMEKEKEQEVNMALWGALRSQLEAMQDVVKLLMSTQGSRQHRKGQSVCSLISHSHC
jgi:predicted O-linked N-acetylglucosamine transferase (SPINDLY family)